MLFRRIFLAVANFGEQTSSSELVYKREREKKRTIKRSFDKKYFIAKIKIIIILFQIILQIFSEVNELVTNSNLLYVSKYQNIFLLSLSILFLFLLLFCQITLSSIDFQLHKDVNISSIIFLF